MNQKNSSSNYLYNHGHEVSLEKAVEMVLAQCQAERIPHPAHPDEKALNASLRDMAGAAQVALTDYREAVKGVHEGLIKKWRAGDNSTLWAFADALEAGDFSNLAI